jgi:hypothetical protein
LTSVSYAKDENSVTRVSEDNHPTLVGKQSDARPQLRSIRALSRHSRKIRQTIAAVEQAVHYLIGDQGTPALNADLIGNTAQVIVSKLSPSSDGHR